jgi:2-(1,2-epoxy-1,2-dihydrophenyl)acetyl-CoA isomerase
MSELVVVGHDVQTGVARIVFNRPEVLNAVDVAMARAIAAAIWDVAARPGVRAILIAATGRAFVSGGDISAFGADPSRSAAVVDAILDAMHPAILALRAQDAPVIAAVRGVAAGAGLSLALAADLIVAEEGTKFVVAYDKLGVSPDCGGTWFLARKAGAARAAEMMLLGRTLDAAEAKEAGIVNFVAPQGRLDEEADALATRVAAGPTRAFGHFRRLNDAAATAPLASHLEAERAAFLDCTATADFREGVAAFLGKRKADFRGA